MNKREKIYTGKNRIITLILGAVFIGLCIWPVIVLGQPGLPEGPQQTPIDGGLSILAAIGGGYAIKKIRENKKE